MYKWFGLVVLFGVIVLSLFFRKSTKRFLELDFLVRPEATERRVAVFEIAEIKATEDEILDKHKISCWCSPELLEGSKKRDCDGSKEGTLSVIYI